MTSTAFFIALLNLHNTHSTLWVRVGDLVHGQISSKRRKLVKLVICIVLVFSLGVVHCWTSLLLILAYLFSADQVHTQTHRQGHRQTLYLHTFTSMVIDVPLALSLLLSTCQPNKLICLAII